MTMQIAERTRKHPMRGRSVTTPRARPGLRRSPRTRVAVAFQALGIGTSEARAYERTKQWYRVAGGAWARALT